jgi:hypothetical protein
MLKRFSPLAALLLLLAAPGILGCDSVGSDDFLITSYVGTYSGTMTTTVREPDRTATVETARATVTVTAPRESGPVTIVIDASAAFPGAPDPAPRILTGTSDATGASLHLSGPSETASFRIHDTGRVSGSGVWLRRGNPVQMTARGQLDARRFYLLIDGAVAQPGGALPVGTTVRIDLDTSR